jgi:hypothetical protein
MDEAEKPRTVPRPVEPCPFYRVPCEYVPKAHQAEGQEAEIAKLRAALEAADAVISRLNGGKELQDLMRANNAHLATIARLMAALESIRSRRYQNRETVTPENAFEAFRKLNAEILAIFDECDAALSPASTVYEPYPGAFDSILGKDVTP